MSQQLSLNSQLSKTFFKNNYHSQSIFFSNENKQKYKRVPIERNKTFIQFFHHQKYSKTMKQLDKVLKLKSQSPEIKKKSDRVKKQYSLKYSEDVITGNRKRNATQNPQSYSISIDKCKLTPKINQVKNEQIKVWLNQRLKTQIIEESIEKINNKIYLFKSSSFQNKDQLRLRHKRCIRTLRQTSPQIKFQINNQNDKNKNVQNEKPKLIESFYNPKLKQIQKKFLMKKEWNKAKIDKLITFFDYCPNQTKQKQQFQTSINQVTFKKSKFFEIKQRIYKRLKQKRIMVKIEKCKQANKKLEQLEGWSTNDLGAQVEYL